MSTHAATAPAALATDSTSSSSAATKALIIGLVGLAVTAAGIALSPNKHGPVMPSNSSIG